MGRRLGQHFLNDVGLLDRIVDALDPQPTDVVLEIGPGKGSLTRRLAPRVGRVVAIEKDERLANQLRDEGRRTRDERRSAKVTVLQGDALDVDWRRVLLEATRLASLVTRPAFKVVGNIPYQITSPLIEKVLTPPLPQVAVMLVQKEVAERLTANPGGREYGGLTVGVQSVARVEKLFLVKAGSFAPPPKVDSAVVRFGPLVRPLVTDAERSGFRTFVNALFSQRRKQLVRSLREVAKISKELTAQILGGIGIPPAARVEVLAPAQLVAVFRAASGSGTL